MDQARYQQLVKQAQTIVTEKAKDYQGKIQLHDYFPFGHRSHVQMIHVKSLRLVNLVEAGSSPRFESIKDTVLDMINYCVFYLDYLERNSDGE